MRTRRTLSLLLVALPLLLLSAAPSEAASLIDYGSSWQYLLGTSEASSPDPTAWQLPGFDDSAWLSGSGPDRIREPS